MWLSTSLFRRVDRSARGIELQVDADVSAVVWLACFNDDQVVEQIKNCSGGSL